MIYQSTPVLGFAAWSGTGKTTLLSKVIPIISAKGYNVGVIKHVHHKFDIDTPGKDSYILRKSGASQIVAASQHRLAYIQEHTQASDDPQLLDALKTLKTETLDIIVVEGYKHEHLPKIELSRSAVDKPPLYPDDPQIFALACDYTADADLPLDILDINNPEQVAQYIIEWMIQLTP